MTNIQQATTLVWFRQDLRISDNPALLHACHTGNILPIYIYDDVNAGEWQNGGASDWWLHHSLKSLNTSLNNNLLVLRGDPKTLIPELVTQYQATQVVWNRCYEPWQRERDQVIKQNLKNSEIEARSFNASLLWEPIHVLKKDGTPYRVFTPYYRKGCLNAAPPRMPVEVPTQMSFIDSLESHQKCTGSKGVEALQLLPQIPWDTTIAKSWRPGEQGAKDKLSVFIKDAATEYKAQRDFPAISGTSNLSPYLHFGEISINQVWYAIHNIHPGHAFENQGLDCYLSELGWREFSYYLLYHFPSLPEQNFQPKFDRFPWRADDTALKAWQQGKTGIPIVDAGMRELWQTGYMHNRVRMIVASFLVKNLLIHWRDGEKWFWDCLLDADLASNSASWQWVAGSGADAAPYFRIFNPVSQGEKFDKEGEYVKTYCPELAKLPAKYIHKPWEAPESLLAASGLALGKDYPKPIVDLAASRKRALDAFATTKGE